MLPSLTTSERHEVISGLFGPTQYQESFGTYIKHYESVLNGQVGRDEPFRDHGEIIRTAQTLRNNASEPRQTLENRIFGGRALHQQEQERAIGCLTAAVFMVVSDSKDYSSALFRDAVKWEAQESFLAFLNRCSRASSPMSIANAGHRHTIHDQSALKLWKLHSRCGLKVLGTNNIFEHLQLDAKARTLRVFHQVTFLRAQLRLADGLPLETDSETSLKRGCLPPRLVFETLLSIQQILLPVVHDVSSKNLLERLIHKEDFDPYMRFHDVVRWESQDLVFEIWARRLDELHRFVRQPPPGNALVAWFERHTSERNALTVAILGLFLSVVIGLLGLVVSILQLVLAWYSYRYPIDK